MTIKKTRSSFILLLSAFVLTSVITISCNDSGEKKEPAKDTAAKMEVAPPVIDTTKRDTAKPRPTLLPNKNAGTDKK